MGSRTPTDARCQRDTMDWTTVELDSIPDSGEREAPEPILAGLSAAPSDLHNAFLSDLPHLAEAQSAHASILQTVGEGVESHFSTVQQMQSVDVVVANLGGFREGDALVLPLEGAIHDRVQLEIGNQGEYAAFRLNIEGENGELLSRTFALPPGTELARAGWRGNELILDLVRD